jgi:hypothetical protein
MLREFVAKGHGVMLIDPHGSLYDAVLSGCAFHGVEKRRRIHLVEPRLTAYAPAFNPLAIPRGVLAEGVSNVVDAMAQVWGGQDMHAYPRLSRMLRNTCYLLAEHNLTLAEAKMLLLPEAKELRRTLARGLSNEYYRAEWAGLEKIPDRDWMEFVESTENRLAPFLSSPVIRRIVGQTERAFDLSHAMENGDLVLVNLRVSPAFTEQSQRLLGTLLLNELRLRALQRKHHARPFYCFVDEAPRFLNADIDSMLVETRKFGLHLILAMQNLGQARAAGEDIYSSLMAIPNRLVFGRLSTKDAVEIAEELFCGEFDLEKPKTKYTTPVTVGYRPIWLESMGSTHSYADFAGKGEADSEGDGRSAPLPIDGAPVDEAEVRTTASKGRATSTSSGTTTSHSLNEGKQQSLAPILEERFTRFYALDELKEEAASLLKNLNAGIAIAKIFGRKPAHVAIPLPKPGLDIGGKRFAAWKDRLFSSSPHSAPAERVDAELEERGARLFASAHAGASSESETEEPAYGRRVLRRVK